jgi:protein-tyrosine phosphatase
MSISDGSSTNSDFSLSHVPLSDKEASKKSDEDATSKVVGLKREISDSPSGIEDIEQLEVRDIVPSGDDKTGTIGKVSTVAAEILYSNGSKDSAFVLLDYVPPEGVDFVAPDSGLNELGEIPELPEDIIESLSEYQSVSCFTPVQAKAFTDLGRELSSHRPLKNLFFHQVGSPENSTVIASMAHPSVHRVCRSVSATLDVVKAMTFDVLVSVDNREHEDVQRLWEDGANREYVYTPIDDYTTPNLEQLEAFHSTVSQKVSENKKIIIHCGAGQGRSGTYIASLKVREAFDRKLANKGQNQAYFDKPPKPTETCQIKDNSVRTTPLVFEVVTKMRESAKGLGQESQRDFLIEEADQMGILRSLEKSLWNMEKEKTTDIN